MNDNGQLGIGHSGYYLDDWDRKYKNFSSPQLVVGNYRWSTIAVGYAHTCGTLEDGTAMCFGA